jgi:DNA helicase IV
LRTFMGHAKGNRLGPDQLRKRVGSSLRSRLFLRLYAAVSAEWDERLRVAGQIDFEDMLNMATDHVVSGRWTSPYRVIMVDEMQDTSSARASLVRSLTANAGTFLYAVGDDWQSINRFAGSDLSVMTEFSDWFGAASTVYLTRTFRSPQDLCDVAGDFIMKNPRQLPKQVRSAAGGGEPALSAVSVPSRGDYDDTVLRHLCSIDRRIDVPASVLLLGRYRKLRDELQGTLRHPYRQLRVEFDTVHGSKGRESDFVVVVAVDRGGFPSSIEDDPLLRLAMSSPDPYPFAEERRLFYVALTRAKRQALIVTQTGRESPFLLELVSSRKVRLRSPQGADVTPVVCPKCKRRTMVQRTGRFGKFLACTGYPLCRNTRNLDGPGGRRVPRSTPNGRTRG